MVGMTTQERYDDICRISGMSEDIVRRVLNAEKKSIESSLARGERATLIGRCVIKPYIATRIAIGGTLETYIKMSAEPSATLKDSVVDLLEFKDSILEEVAGVRVNQIEALT